MRALNQSKAIKALKKYKGNKTIDNYIEEPFDISNVLFILTANNLYDIPLYAIGNIEAIVE